MDRLAKKMDEAVEQEVELEQANKVPDAPFKKNWHELAFKRALTEAINDPTIERLTWTTGAVQADRYDLSKQISEVHLSGSNFVAYDHDGVAVIKQTGVRDEDLPDLIGKEASEKLLAQPRQGTLRSLTGQDLQVGGEFHKQLYDGKTVRFAKKFLKKYGVEPKKARENLPLSGYEIVDKSTPKAPATPRGQPWFDVIHTESGQAVQKAFPSREEAHEWLLKSNFNPDVWYIDITPEMRFLIGKYGVPLTQRRKQMGLMAGYA